MVDVPSAPPTRLRDDGDGPAPSAPRSVETDVSAAGYFTGTWKGTYHGMAATSTLEVDADGHFWGIIHAPRGGSCDSTGDLWVERDTLFLRFDNDSCNRDGRKLIRRKLLYADPNEFRTADPRRLDAIEQLDDGGVTGPVWTYRRIE